MFKSVVDTQLLACMTTSSYQRGVSDRFLQHISLVALPATSQASFQLIFTAMLQVWLDLQLNLRPRAWCGLVHIYTGPYASPHPNP